MSSLTKSTTLSLVCLTMMTRAMDVGAGVLYFLPQTASGTRSHRKSGAHVLLSPIVSSLQASHVSPKTSTTVVLGSSGTFVCSSSLEGACRTSCNLPQLSPGHRTYATSDVSHIISHSRILPPCADWTATQCGTRVAGQAFNAVRDDFEVNDFSQGVYSPCVDRHKTRRLRCIVRGGGYVGLGAQVDLEWFRQQVSKRFIMTRPMAS